MRFTTRRDWAIIYQGHIVYVIMHVSVEFLISHTLCISTTSILFGSFLSALLFKLVISAIRICSAAALANKYLILIYKRFDLDFIARFNILKSLSKTCLKLSLSINKQSRYNPHTFGYRSTSLYRIMLGLFFIFLFKFKVQ